MCGRFAIGANPELVASYFDVELPKLVAQPSWNVAPTDPANIICNFGQGEESQMTIMNWGFDLSGGSGRSPRKVFNARHETIASKWRFKSAVQWNRCLIPATGWFEWTTAPDGKDPHFMSQKLSNSPNSNSPNSQNQSDQSFSSSPSNSQNSTKSLYSQNSQNILALAGLWEKTDSDLRFTIITRPALPSLSEIHNRMPLVLPKSEWKNWLDPNNSTASSQQSIRSATESIAFSNHRVSRKVNNSRSEGFELISLVED